LSKLNFFLRVQDGFGNALVVAKDLAQVAAVCRNGYYQLQATRHSPDLSTHKDVTRKDAGPGIHFVSPGLLQLSVLRHHRRSDEPVAVCPECGFTFGVGRSAERPHHTSLLAADCQLVSDEGGRQLRSATSRTSVVKRTYSNYRERYFAAAGPKL